MSGIFDQLINYAPPSKLTGTVTYKGTWNASTNTPTLVDPTDSTTNGHYYVVSAAGTQFSLVFNIGDWVISDGTNWEKVDNTDAVDSVFGRTGAVVGVSTDYSAVGITNTALGASNPSTVAATTVTATSTIAATGAVTGSNLSGTNTGDQTITLTGGVTGSGTGSFAATVVTNANSTGAITSVGNATSLGSFSSANLSSALTDETGSGVAVFATSPTLVTPNLGTPASGTLTSCTGLPISTGVSGLGTGVATALAANVGSAGAPVVFNGALGTPTSGTVTNLTGTASININGTVGATTPAAGSFTTLGATGDGTFASGGGTVTIGAAGTGATAANLTLTGSSAANRGAYISLKKNGTEYNAIGHESVVNGGGSTSNDLIIYGASGTNVKTSFGGIGPITTTSATGFAVTGTGTTSGNFGAGAAADGTFALLASSTTQRAQLTLKGSNVVGIRFQSTDINGSERNWGFANNIDAQGSLSVRYGASQGADPTTTMAQFSSTGLAVTGALNATGYVTGAGTNPGGLGGSRWVYDWFSGDHRNFSYGANSSTNGAWSWITQRSDGSNSVTPMSLTSTGLAVTGTLSSSGNANFLNAKVDDGNWFYWGASGDSRITGSSSSDEISILTNNAQRMLVNNTGLAVTGTLSCTTGANFATSSGNVGIGTSNSDPTNNRVNGMFITNEGRLYARATGSWDLGSNSSTPVHITFYTDNGSARITAGSISSSSSTTAFNTSSDARLKINVRDYSTGNLFDLLQPRIFDWRSGEKNSIGFIAQELYAVYPQAVSPGDDGEEIERTWGVDFSKLAPALVAEVKSLRQRLAALEAK